MRTGSRISSGRWSAPDHRAAGNHRSYVRRHDALRHHPSTHESSELFDHQRKHAAALVISGKAPAQPRQPARSSGRPSDLFRLLRRTDAALGVVLAQMPMHVAEVPGDAMIAAHTPSARPHARKGKSLLAAGPCRLGFRRTSPGFGYPLTDGK